MMKNDFIYIDTEKISERIDNILLEKGITTQEVSVMLNISYQAVNKWRRGLGLPDIENLYLLSQITGVTIDRIIAEDTSVKQEELEPCL
ncbi:MAG: helix-turn-helix transcriptional regulator [Lachnospiraceae bacterium]|nr:helix-turn-helix transcriptional regulator [Lachnospiraceae bacterium]